MYPTEYIQFLIHFQGDYDYFECHEILEEYWKTKPRGNRDHYLVGLIQIAVSLYHQRRANWNGSTKMMKSAITILEKSGVSLQRLGINQVQLLSMLNERLQSIHKKERFVPLFLPLSDPLLEKQCIELCKKQNLSWKDLNAIPSEYIIHKHTLRDRTEVITERNEQLQKRKQR
ncbi:MULTISPECIES: DUF309 domain-containing protein [Bacillus]|uniref:DUF309 domain-containing protein n=1 Tax=Bacillus TaxID=1386 RepID=UPI0008FE999E|nr:MULTISPECIES: DUF309 domain-containing protein [Bacillus cereus group]MDF9464087.1 DUF309 domain-containing protein [Bacillus cereus]MED3527986.1 DUF309 domain-containing protein [Bacillus thuringiensis]OJE14796.1 hypothetical protein A9489_06285 [Bacillus thuringiensis]PEF02547.1 DUF309 domain-containing protein [Bacillus thuringiensis]PGP27210.1 DUF309 domain-containing protein [Bacillus thuringiensis]